MAYFSTIIFQNHYKQKLLLEALLSFFMHVLLAVSIWVGSSCTDRRRSIALHEYYLYYYYHRCKKR